MPSTSRRGFLAGSGALLAGATRARPVAGASSPAVRWSHSYTPTDEDSGLVRAVVQTDDGYVLAGVGGWSQYRGWVVGIDDAGNRRWQQVLGVRRSGFLAGAPAPDGGAVLAGGTNAGRPMEPDTDDPWLVRVSTTGSVEWERTLQDDVRGGSATALTRLGDGYVVAGDYGSDESRPWVAAVDRYGKVEWEWRDASRGRVGRAQTVATVDGDVVGAGSVRPDDDDTGGSTEDAWVVRLTGDGTVAWERRFDGDDGERIEGLASDGNGGVVAVGKAGFAEYDHGVARLTRIDRDGDVRWRRTYPTDRWNWLNGVARVDDGYVLVGTRKYESDNRAGWVVGVDDGGRVRWRLTAEDEPGSEGYAVQPTDDGGLLVGGSTARDGSAPGWVTKLGGDDSGGDSPSSWSGIPTLPSPPSWTFPLLAGVGIGTVVGALGKEWRDSD